VQGKVQEEVNIIMTKHRTQTHRTGNLPPRSNFCLTTARSRFQKGLPAWSRVSHLRPASLVSCIRLCRESRQSWAEVGRACSEGSLQLLRELARLWTSFSSLDSRSNLFRRRIDMAHPCERVSMYVLLKACQEYGTVQGSRRTDGREGDRVVHLGGFPLQLLQVSILFDSMARQWCI
jgi:hypothetical protein